MPGPDAADRPDNETMRHVPRIPDPAVRPTAASDQGAYLMVSLYLLLLAFFIVLFTASRTDSVRADRAIGSVYDTFRLQDGSEVSRLTAGVSTGQFQSRDPFLTSLNQIFEAEFPLGQYALVQHGKRFEALLSPDDLFVDDSVSLLPAARRLIVSMASGLASHGGAGRFEIELVLPAGEAAKLNIERAAHVADQVRRAGAPASSISAGIVADAQMVRISAFRRPAWRDAPATAGNGGREGS